MHKKSIHNKKVVKPLNTGFTPQNDLVSFSFKYFELTEKFHLNNISSNYFVQLLDKLQNLSKIEIQKLLKDNSYRKAIRMHIINWSDTSELNGFANLPQHLNDLTPWQFNITSNAHGRVHGFLIENIFYIVWLDTDHLLYSGK